MCSRIHADTKSKAFSIALVVLSKCWTRYPVCIITSPPYLVFSDKLLSTSFVFLSVCDSLVMRITSKLQSLPPYLLHTFSTWLRPDCCELPIRSTIHFWGVKQVSPYLVVFPLAILFYAVSAVSIA